MGFLDESATDGLLDDKSMFTIMESFGEGKPFDNTFSNNTVDCSLLKTKIKEYQNKNRSGE